MCRMMAVSAKRLIKAEWILPFESLSICGKIRSDMTEPGHHDGWGMVSYFKPGFPEYVGREPHSVTQDSETFRQGAKGLEESNCKIALVHFRKISVGKPMISNTHPFLCKQWSFCHNGTIYDSEKIPLKNLKPAGTTDTERYFLYLMENIRQDKNRDEQMSQLKKAIGEIKNRFDHSSLTFLLTDGEIVYAYRECDPQFADYYTLYTAKTKEGILFSSEPLEDLKVEWEPLENGTLLAAKENDYV